MNFSTTITGLACLILTLQAQAVPESSFSIQGLTPEQAGLAIFREADRRESGYGDLQVDLEMVLRTSSGDESRRDLRIRQLEVDGDGDRLLVVFDTPKPISGTALLSYAHKLTADDQWLYLPALKRVKRITSQNKSGPFLSSEFAYEDLALQEVEKYSYRLIQVQGSDENTSYVVERTPTDEFSGYARQVVVVDAAELRVQSIEYFDRRNRLLKTLEATGYELYAGHFWKPSRMLMANVQSGKSTELVWRNYRFGTGLEADRDFSTNSLRRVR
ncbi:MAG: outer membrane lipoprotein-sorting protein [Pseudomonadales bacterium]|nr:outer membrane lipoprotein-sorting protein [Pseudomonadales bacterium]